MILLLIQIGKCLKLIAWAKHSLTLELKLEWEHAIRRTLWYLIGVLDEEKDIIQKREDYHKWKNHLMKRLINFYIIFFLAIQTSKLR